MQRNIPESYISYTSSQVSFMQYALWFVYLSFDRFGVRHGGIAVHMLIVQPASHAFLETLVTVEDTSFPMARV